MRNLANMETCAAESVEHPADYIGIGSGSGVG